MFEHKSQRIISPKHFAHRLLRSLICALILTVASLFAGMCGYHFIEDISWVDSFLNASMILGGMGPVDTMKTDAGKIFAGSYALYSGLVIIVSMGIILGPMAHRLLHSFHADADDDKDKDKDKKKGKK